MAKETTGIDPVKTLKEFPEAIQTASQKARLQVFQDVEVALASTRLNDGIAKGLSKVLLLTLYRYYDARSRRRVREFIRFLILKGEAEEVNFKDALASVINDYCSLFDKLIVTDGSSKALIEVFKWLVIIGHSTKQLPPKFLDALIRISGLIHTPRLALSMRDKIGNLYSSLDAQTKSLLVETSLKSLNGLITLSYVIQHLSVKKKIEDLPATKQSICEAYIQNCLTTRSKIDSWKLDTISKGIITMLGRDEFDNILMPAIRKAMLRSPETAVEAVSYAMLHVKLDISSSAQEFAKLFGSLLHSQDDATRDLAVDASKCLTQKIESAEAVLQVVDWYISVFNGAEGKLTVATHKISILQALKSMSNTVVADEQKGHVSKEVINKCAKILEGEAHEGTLIEGCEVITSWSHNLGDNIPDKLADFVPKGLSNLKGQPRLSLTAALVTIFPTSRIRGLAKVLPEITKIVEKNSGLFAQVPVLSETIALQVLLHRGLTAGVLESVPKAGPLFDAVSSKFVSSAEFHSCLHVIELGSLVINKNEKVPSSLYTALAICLANLNYKVRNAALKAVQNLTLTNEGPQLFLSLVRAFETVQKENITVVSPKIIETVAGMCYDSVAAAQSKAITETDYAIEFLNLCHQNAEQGVWERVLRKLHLNVADVIRREWKRFQSFIDNFQNDLLHRRILQTLTVHTSRTDSRVRKPVVDRFQRFLEDPAIMTVSRDDYFVFRTPAGQLYDNSCVDSANESGKNMKRESKAYSFQDQLEEIKLRKELDEKRKQSGKAPQFTPKQKEALKLQLEKESAIRKQVAELDQKVQNAVGLLDAILQSHTDEIFFVIPSIFDLLINIMSSPVAAPVATSFFVSLTKSAFQDASEVLGTATAQISLRLIKPQCDLEPGWQEEPLLNAIKRLIKEYEKLSNDREKYTKACYLTSFPLFERVVRSYSKDSDCITSVLNTTIAVLKNRSADESLSIAVLPKVDMTVLLYHVIGTNTGRVQQSGISAILELSKAEADNEVNHCSVDPLELKKHLDGITSHLRVVRSIGLRCLSILRVPMERKWKNQDALLWNSIKGNIYREQFDPERELASLATELYSEICGSLEQDDKERHSFEDLHEELVKCTLHTTSEVRSSAAMAMRELLSHNEKFASEIADRLINLYNEYSVMIPPVYDHLGRILQEGIDKWESRCGVGLTSRKIAELLPLASARKVFQWLVAETLADRDNTVHTQMLEAAVEVVQHHGKEHLNEFVQVIEATLESAGRSSQYDNVRQACVVLMGSLAKHIDPKDPRVRSIFDTLLETLGTPSEKVQEAVANCLPGLVPSIKDRESDIIKGLLTTLLTAETYGERRGAAYGLAGLIKGLGILSLKQHDVMTVLANSMQDKKNYKHREGALMALELLCEFLGRLFEPYIVHVLPFLLQCLGDSNQYVREATDNTTRVLMSKLSGHGVKLVLPSLLAALDEDSWRTKCGSVDLLGRMAYCAPKQLSGCLPMIVPRLIEVLSDSHVKVQESGAKALGLIGSVIRNPEIQSVVRILLDALEDPAKKTAYCLQALLKTEFVHFVDPPSLALIMPVVQRAFQDRSTENRKMAAQIIGNMYSLTDHTDLAPYMEKVMPGLKASLLDPVPEVRAVAAKALGSMSKGMGDKCYEELLPWLMKTLISEANSVDRSGGAQGLAEVIGALGEEKMHRFMPEIIRKADSDDLAPHVRDGYMMMFIYMPGVFEDAFVPYIGQIINPILRALADENEYVRETALKAGQRIVTGFAESAITLLLPELEKGIFDDNWRIRFSSIQLLGDLLYKISGVSGKMSTESASDDDNFGTEQSQKAIAAALGGERRNRVLAGLYMGRSDVALMVRQAALHVWKVVVANTPKTLREILPTLFSLLLGCLASPSHDKRQVAARTLGDLVRKLGEKILPEIIPILEKGLDSPRDDERQGVCIGLSEIMASTSREMVMAFVDNLVPTLRKALCDSSPEVREAAAQTFGSLHSTVGTRALDEILPYMMKKLYDETEGDYALHGLGQVLQVKSKAVLPYLIPQLTAPPANTKALAILASVAGDSLSKHLNKILPALISVLIKAEGTPEYETEKGYCDQVVLSITDEHGVRLLIEEFLDLIKTSDQQSKRAVVTLLSSYCIHTKGDLEPYTAVLLRGLILLLVGDDNIILRSSADAITAIVKALSPEDQQRCVSDVRNAIRYAQMELKGKTTLPGLCLPKGINPLLPIFREALLNGGADLKEQAAIGMGELIALSSPDALKPSVVHITGPLIRILGDRYGPNVKTSVLDTLTLLLGKIGAQLRAFLPQLQTTFLKAVVDPQRSVRLKAATAMSRLIPIHNKPDPLFSELIQATSSADSSMRDTLLYTLRCVITPAGDKISEPLRKTILTELNALVVSQDDATRLTAASCLGALLKWLPEADLDSVITDVLSACAMTDDKDAIARHGKSTVLVVGVKEGPHVVYSEKLQPKVDKVIASMLTSDKVPIVSNGVRACAHLFTYCLTSEKAPSIPSALAQPFSKALNNASNEVKVLLGNSCDILGRRIYPKALPKDLLRYILPSLVNGTKEKNSMVRASCESALISLMHMRNDPTAESTCLEALDSGAREALSDVISKALKKQVNQLAGKEPEMDDTILT